MKRFPSIWHLLALAVILWGGEYKARDLWEPDEARYAYVAREMRETGDWAVPHRHGEYYAQKPPLMFWLINAGACFTGGEITRVSTRLPSFLGALLSLWAIAGIARRWASAEAAWKAVLILMTTYLFWNKGGMGQIDSLLTGLEMLALYQLVAYDDDHRPWRPLLAYSSMGFAILAKGPVGFIVPLGMYIAGTLAARDGTRRLRAHYAWGPLVALLPPAIWLAWVAGHNPPPGYLHELLFQQNVSRAAGELGHVSPFYFYVEHFPLEFLPWTPLWLLVWPAYKAFTNRGSSPAPSPDAAATMRRLLAWIAFDVVFFSLSPSKRELYILAAYPPAALLVAMSWPAVTGTAARVLARFWVGFLSVAGLTILGTLAVDRVHHLLPFDSRSLLVPGLLLLAGAWLVHRRHRLDGACTPAVFAIFACTMFLTEVSVGTLVYAAVNPLKAPYPVAAAATRYLAPGETLLLYRMNGEIMALYAQHPGEAVGSAAALEQLLKARRHGLVVMDQQQWREVPDILRTHALRQEFRMGNKHLLWAYLDLRSGAGVEQHEDTKAQRGKGSDLGVLAP